MNLKYTDPVLNIRLYYAVSEYITTSDPDQTDPGLDDGTPHGDIFG